MNDENEETTDVDADHVYVEPTLTPLGSLREAIASQLSY